MTEGREEIEDLGGYAVFASRLNSARRHIRFKCNNRPGWVYVAQLDGDDPLVKIGMSMQRDPRKRVSTVVRWEEGNLIIRGIAKTNTPGKMERVLHAVFADKRVAGEWFRLDADELRWLFVCANFAHSHEQLEAML